MISTTERSLGDALVIAKMMTPEQLADAIKSVESKTSPNLILQLIEKEYLAFKVFQKFLTQNYSIKTVILASKEIPAELLHEVGFKLMRERLIMPLVSKNTTEGKKLALAMVNPLDEKTIEEVQKKTGHDVTAVLASLPDFNEALAKYAPLDDRFERTPIVTYDEQLGPAQMKLQSYDSVSMATDIKESRPVEYLGKNPKKFKEEIAMKLDLEAADLAKLKAPSYNRGELMAALSSAKKSSLEKNFESLDIKSKFEALTNVLIHKGLISKYDLYVSGAVSRVFGEDKN